MTIRRKVFTSQKITIKVNPEIRVQALVSPYGAKYIFDDSELPDVLRNKIGEEIQLTYKNIPVKARFVRESTPQGIIYNLRFLNPSRTLVKQIERDILESGLPSPWMRSLPRLTTLDKHLPAPTLAVLYYMGQTYFLTVNDFTLGGVQLEFVGTDLDTVFYGDKLEFDLVINTGDKISDVEGKVTHIAAEKNVTTSGLNRYLFGVKFLSMPMLSQTKYRGIIKEHCMGLKNEPELGV